jgi:hypothetical protein
VDREACLILSGLVALERVPQSNEIYSVFKIFEAGGKNSNKQLGSRRLYNSRCLCVDGISANREDMRELEVMFWAHERGKLNLK